MVGEMDGWMDFGSLVVGWGEMVGGGGWWGCGVECVDRGWWVGYVVVDRDDESIGVVCYWWSGLSGYGWVMGE